MTSEVQVTSYTEAVKSYYLAIWAGTSGTEDARKTAFEALEKAINARTEKFTETDKPAGLTLEAANELLAKKLAATEAAKLLGDAEVIDKVTTAVTGALRPRLLNTLEGSILPPGEIGTLSPSDVKIVTSIGDEIRVFATPLMSKEDAIITLDRWLKLAERESNTTLQAELLQLLGLTDVKELATVDLSGANYEKVLTAFQTLEAQKDKSEVKANGKLDIPTIRALKIERGNWSLDGHMALDAVGNGANAIGQWSADSFNFLKGSVDNLMNPKPADPADPAAVATTDKKDDPMGDIFKGIGDFFGGTSAGGWLGILGGGLLAWFASNMFGAGPFRMIMMVLAVPLMAMLGRDALNGWDIFGGGGDKAADQKDAPVQSQTPAKAQEAGKPVAQTVALDKDAEARQAGMDVMKLLELPADGTPALQTASQTDDFSATNRAINLKPVSPAVEARAHS